MNPLNFGLRRPITVVVAMTAIVIGSVVAWLQMRKDVFPDLNMPVIYVAQAYGGMDAAQMEGLITSYYEMVFLYMNGIDHVESKNIQNLAMIKLYFHPGTDMAQAMAEAAIYANRAKAYFPPGTIPPFIMRLDASSAPVSFLVLSSETRNINELSDLMLFRVRPTLSNIEGATAPQPFGGSLRTIIVYLDPERLRSYKLSPQKVVDALNKGNTITPSGNARVADQNPIVSINSLVLDPQDLGNIPIIPEQSIYLRDLGRVEDGADVATGFALVNGRRAIYLPIVKTAEASTLAVVNGLRNSLDRMRSVLPEDVKLSLEFDQSPYVTNATRGVRDQSAIGAILTGIMVLLFLRDWRTVVVVLLTIPLALMGAVLGLWAIGQTINLMTLGGLSLAVGILVNTATVVIENIHTHMAKSTSIAEAVKNGTSETIIPILLAMLCILAVFLPSFLMEGAARGLFVPLALAVGFAMIAAFLLSTTFIPVFSIWLIRLRRPEVQTQPGGFSLERWRERYAAFCLRLTGGRHLLIPAYIIGCGLVLWLAFTQVGREIAPSVDSGQFQLRIRAPSGTRLRVSEQITREALKVINDVVGPENVDISVSYIGVTAPTYTVNAIFQWTGGTDSALARVSLRHGSGLRVAEVKEKLRAELPKRLEPWLRQRLTEMGYSEAAATARAEQLRFAFEPADVVNQVMSFGSPTPVEVVISGPDLAANTEYAKRVESQMRKIESLRDLQFGQVMDYPRINIAVDRERAGFAGVTETDASTAMIAATSSSRYVLPIFWADPKSGIGYQVQLEVPPTRVDSSDQVGMIPVRQLENGQVLMRDISRIGTSTMPEEYDRLNQLRYVSLTANIEGEDLGRVTNRIDNAVKAAGELPRGVRVEMRGQVTPMRQMFQGLAVGLGLAVIVVFLLLTAYFQSMRLALVAVATVPSVLVGVAIALYATHTTLNIESFMGVIMAIGVAVANAILLVTFAERYRVTGETSANAAVMSARDRLRSIMMASCAMIAGMIPMALGMGDGGEQTAPLGRAVVGGLVAATLTTLFILPAVFAAVLGKSSARSPSLHPDDPESSYFSPHSESPDEHPEGIQGASRAY
jgi:multidrug efflux pump subunit AcrB